MTDSYGADERLDDALEALSNVHRRRLLIELREDNPHGELPHGSLGTGREVELTVEMNHAHLPRLESDGYIEWDRDEGVVLRGPRFEELEPLLSALDGDETVPLDDDGCARRGGGRLPVGHADGDGRTVPSPVTVTRGLRG